MKELTMQDKFPERDHPKEFYELTDEQQERLLSWCNSLDKIDSFNWNNSSYGLKHIFEDSPQCFYVTNGQFKGAMLLAGFSVKDKNQVNWNFNVSKKSIKEKRSVNGAL